MFDNNPERRYVSLMHEISNYYASWDPLKSVRIGDYGHLQKDYSFIREGNIFANGLAEEFEIDTESSDADELRWIAATQTSRQSISGEVSIGNPSVTQMGIKQTFTISRSFGAILVMLNPRRTALKEDSQIKDLIYSTAFSGKHVLVTEVYTCQSYARLLAPRQTRAVEVGLDSTHAQFLHGHAHLEWRTSAEGGDFRYSHSDRWTQEESIQPLFKLVGRRTRKMGGLRRSHRPVTELDPPRWRRVIVPSTNEGRGGKLDDFDDDEATLHSGGANSDAE